MSNSYEEKKSEYVAAIELVGRRWEEARKDPAPAQEPKVQILLSGQFIEVSFDDVPGMAKQLCLNGKYTDLFALADEIKGQRTVVDRDRKNFSSAWIEGTRQALVIILKDACRADSADQKQFDTLVEKSLIGRKFPQAFNRALAEVSAGLSQERRNTLREGIEQGYRNYLSGIEGKHPTDIMKHVKHHADVSQKEAMTAIQRGEHAAPVRAAEKPPQAEAPRNRERKSNPGKPSAPALT